MEQKNNALKHYLTGNGLKVSVALNVALKAAVL
jgi:hypothetical protein